MTMVNLIRPIHLSGEIASGRVL